MAPGKINVHALKLLLEARLDGSDRRYEQRFIDNQRGVEAAFAAAKEATTKAETAAERRLESVNEFRAQLSDQASTFITRVEYDAKLSSLSERVSEVSDRINQMAGHSTGMTDAQRVTIAFITIVVAIAGIITSVIVAVSR